MRSRIVAAFLIGAMAAPANGQEADKKLLGNVSGFLAATKALSTAADERIQLAKSVDRLARIRERFTNEMNKAPDGDFYLSLKAESLQDILCKPRMNAAGVAADAAYVKSVSGSIESVATQKKIDSIGAAVGVIFSNYDISVTENKDAAKKISDIQTLCVKDLSSFGPTYYASSGDDVFAVVAFVGAVAALWEAIQKIVTPIVTAVGQAADDRNRINAIEAFIKDPKNGPEIRESTKRLANAVNRFAHYRRNYAIGQFAESMAVASTIKIPLKELGACANLKPDAFKGAAPDIDAMGCYAQAWKRIEEPVASALKAADQYDKFADAGYGVLPAGGAESKLSSDINKQLDALLNPKKLSTKDQLKALYEGAIKLIAFGQTVNGALSSTNRDAVKKAIDDLVKLI